MDGLRGIAAVAVVLFHYVKVYGDRFGHDFRPPAVFSLGFFGVHLFFLISGFVILMSVERIDRPLDFLRARAIRLYPTYWSAVALTAAVLLLDSIPVSAGEVLANLTMFQTFLGVSDLDPAYWTLAHEVAFYLLMAVGVWTKLVHRIELVCAAATVLVLGCSLAERAGMISVAGPIRVLLLIDYLPLFVAGMMFYRLRTRGHHWLRHALIAAVPLSVLILVGPAPVPLGVLTGFLVLFYALNAGWLSFLGARPLVLLGTLSYALYATHQLAGYVLIHALRRSGLGSLPSVAATLMTALVLALLVVKWVEEPVRTRLGTSDTERRAPTVAAK